MRMMLYRSQKGLHGATEEDQATWIKFKAKLEKMKLGAWLRLEASSPRHGPHHRKFMALLSLIKDNSEVWDTTAKALIAVKLVVGHFDLCADPTTGEITKVPRSIAYEKMEQGEFDVFYGQAIDGVVQHILPQMDADTAMQLLEQIEEGWIAQ